MYKGSPAVDSSSSGSSLSRLESDFASPQSDLRKADFGLVDYAKVMPSMGFILPEPTFLSNSGKKNSCNV